MIGDPRLEPGLVGQHALGFIFGRFGGAVGAAVEPARFESLGDPRIQHQPGCRLPIDAGHRRGVAPFALRRGEGVGRVERREQLEEGARGAEIILGFPGEADPGRQADIGHDFVAGVGKSRVATGLQAIVDGTQEAAVEEAEAEKIIGISFLVRLDPFIEIIKAGDAAQFRARINQLEFLAGLVLANPDEHVADLILSGVDIDVIVGPQIAVGGDRLEGQRIGQIDRERRRAAPMGELGRIGEARSGPAGPIVAPAANRVGDD